MLGDTGNKRAVRILQECILVYKVYLYLTFCIFSDTQVEAEIVLGLSGVLIVILSVSSAIGLCSYMQIPGQFQRSLTVTVN